MSREPDYYSTEGGEDYKAFLEHFKRQAETSSRPVLLNSRTGGIGFGRGRIGRGHLILVETGRNKGTTKNGTGFTKIESVDPNEAERRRAVDQAAKDESEMSKEAETMKYSHSTGGSRKRKTDSKGSTSKTKSKIQRAKDVFDD